MESIVTTVKDDVVAFIEGNSELFFNERDFQMHLAVYLRNLGKYGDVDVEYYVPHSELDHYIWKNELRLDVVVYNDNEFVPIELKYKTKAVEKQLPRFQEDMTIQVMKNQGAQDVGMYDFWKDVRRLEMVRNRFTHVTGGLAVFLTNDKAYQNDTKKSSNNYLFSMSNGIHHKQKHWQNMDSVCARNHMNFEVEKDYEIKWREIAVEGVKMNYCIVEI